MLKFPKDLAAIEICFSAAYAHGIRNNDLVVQRSNAAAEVG